FHADHSAADDIRCRSLDRRVDRRAFVEGTDRRIGGADFRIVGAPAEDRLHVAILAAERLGLLHVIPDARETLEITLDVSACFITRYAKLVGQPEGGDTVDDAEIDCLGTTADFTRHAFDGNTKHFGSGHRMDIETVGKSLSQLRDFSNVCQYAQLDLTVVDSDE